MIHDRGHWSFDDDYTPDYTKSYPAIRKSLGIVLETLISTKILRPKRIGSIPLVYTTVDELMEQIEATGYFEDASEFDINGDTVIHTSNGEEIFNNIISIDSFRTSEPYFVFVAGTDHWLPMMMDSKTLNFSWNVELYQLNYHRIPAVLKKLKEKLEWKNEDFFYQDDWFISSRAGFDFFLREYIITREYNDNPNPAFDLEAYLAVIAKAKELYPL